MSNIELVDSGNNELVSLFSEYEKLEKKFGEIIWGKIQDFFPTDFDVSLLSLENILAEIKWNGESGNRRVALRRIKNDMYPAGAQALYDIIKDLHGYRIGDLVIEVQSYNLEENNLDFHQVNIRFVKDSNIIIEGEIVSTERKNTQDQVKKLL